MARPWTLIAARVFVSGGLIVLLASLTGNAQGPANPSIDDLINLKRLAGSAISPDGTQVAYGVRETNWDENAYETEIWIADRAGTPPRQLTNAKKSSQQPAWSPDGRWIAFISDRDGKRQIYRIAVAGGEAERLTNTEDGVGNFAWAPGGAQIALTMTDPVTDAMKDREKRWGDIRIEDQDQRYTHLHLFDLTTRATTRLTSGTFVVGSFDWSPDGTRVAFDHRRTSDAADGGTADISIVSVATQAREIVVSQEGSDSNPVWSPDGTQLAFETSMGKTASYLNRAIAVVRPGSAPITNLTASFDENPGLVAWTKSGLYFSATQRVWSSLFSLDPSSRAIRKLAVREQWIAAGFSMTPDGTAVAFSGSGPSDIPDLYLARVDAMASATRVTNLAAQVSSWPKHARELVRWKSQDGAEIEGVLHKPADFLAGRRYPLLIVIHGGPTGVSRPVPYGSTGTYPIDAFLSKGALVLEPNYRGSAGYGEKFRSLNVRNLGIGDAWDVVSGIDHLVAQGLVDRDRVGSMGWSQGGYISAFLTTRHSDRFKAISAGAGISDWMTYYVNTDIHQFTRTYLQATPWDDPKVYADTSPITYIKQARTPTLIQHGDQDARVPIPNAFELYQGLRDQNVPVQLSVFKGFGHGVNRPKANRALMEQNYEWFLRYLWNTPTSSQP
jgi:dipeptidyl aminopeptidase/acylaminoacyl peptidase